MQQLSDIDEALANNQMPSVKQALLEAANAPYPKDQYQWSHPAVYWAGFHTGWPKLRSGFSVDKLLPEFAHQYSLQLERVLNGEAVSMPPRHSTPGKPYARANTEKARSVIASIRGMLP